MTKESSDSLPRQATHASLLLCPSPKSFTGMHSPHCVLPLPFIVVAIVVEHVDVVAKHLNVVAEHQSHARIAVVIFVRACDVQSSSLLLNNLVAEFQ